MLVIMPTLIFIFWKMEQAINPKPFYYESPQKLHLTESRMSWRQFDNGLRIVLTGVVTNDSNIPWDSLHFECRFFDTNGTIIDVANLYEHAIVQPHDDNAFRLLAVPARDTNVYSSYRLIITDAKNSGSRF